MWIYNILLVLLFEAIIILFYLKDNQRWFIISLILSYLLAPVIKIGQLELSSSYLFTLTFTIIIIKELVSKKINISKRIKLYLIFMSISAISMLLGLLINANPSLRALFAFSGYLQTFLLVTCFALYFEAIPKESVDQLIIPAIGITTIANLVTTIIQFFSIDFGYFVVRQFYAHQYRSAPVENFRIFGGISRGTGLTYSPVVLAVFMVIFCAWLIGKINAEYRSYRIIFLIFLTSLTSMLAISKTSILGIIILIPSYIVLTIFYHISKRDELSFKSFIYKISSLIVPIIASVILTLLISDSLGLGFRQYLTVLTNPLNAFNTRYAVEDTVEDVETTVKENAITPTQNSSTENTDQPTPSDPQIAQDKVEEVTVQEGILADTLRIIKQHPIVGVGPLPIEGEFLGDSQFAIILHHGGLLNALAYILFFGYLFIEHLMKGNVSELLVLMMIAATGFAAVTIFMPGISFLIAYCIRENSSVNRFKGVAVAD